MAENGEFLGYKGKPLVRCGDTIYYGKMTDPYVVMLQVLETEQSHEMQMAKRVSLHLMKTDPNCNPLERIVKKGLELHVPYELTWSCYEGGEKPCGVCGTCRDRQAAFLANGVEDPLLK